VCAGGGAGAGRARRPPWAQCARAPVTERRSDAGMQLAALHCPSTPPFEMAFSAASARAHAAPGEAMNSAAACFPPSFAAARDGAGAFSGRAHQLSLVALKPRVYLPPLLSAAPPAGRGGEAIPRHDLRLMRARPPVAALCAFAVEQSNGGCSMPALFQHQHLSWFIRAKYYKRY